MVALALAWLAACGTPEAPPAPKKEVPEQCKHVDLENLGADWILVADGSRADPKTRLRIVADGAGYKAFYVGGFFDKHVLTGVKNAEKNHVIFNEEPSAALQKRVNAGLATLVQLKVEPKLETCSLALQQRKKSADDKTAIAGNVELMAFPAGGPEFSWEPWDSAAFLGEAAQKKATADAELAATGEPRPDVPSGKVPIAAWSNAAADGDAACTYDFDLWFDDQLKDAKLPAEAPKDGVRRWGVDAELPFGGNHAIELYRYRTCAGGERTRIGVAGVSAVLM